jgi:hypothetical protein
LIRRAQGLDSLCRELALEIRQQFRQLHRRFNLLKFLRGGKNFRHLPKILRIVGAQINPAAGSEHGTGERWKMFIDEPVPVMFPLWPRIGEINVQRNCRMSRQQILQEIRRLEAHAAQIGEADAATLPVQLLDAAEQPFDADEILLGMSAREFHEKRSIAATEFDFERLRFRKKFRQIQRLDNGRKPDNEILLIFKLGSQITNCQPPIKTKLVGAVRFELTTSWTRTKRASQATLRPDLE